MPNILIIYHIFIINNKPLPHYAISLASCRRHIMLLMLEHIIISAVCYHACCCFHLLICATSLRCLHYAADAPLHIVIVCYYLGIITLPLWFLVTPPLLLYAITLRHYYY